MPIARKHRRLLGDNIRLYRLKAGLSQEKLAEKADLHTNYVGDIERGEENVSVDALVRLASSLRVKVADLVAGL
ncbi:MAG: helix-turn-helix transcriptional regulator [Limisphaerales bacterium]